MVLEAAAVFGAIPRTLREELLGTYNGVLANYRAGKWEPSELNGGKFCEVVYSILHGYVNGRFPNRASKPRNMVAACQGLEQATAFPRSIRIQIPRMLIALYEVRNNRNVGHVGGDVDPNHMDAVCVVGMTRWILAELVRVFHQLSTDDASAVVESLSQREVPIVWQVGSARRVLRSDLPTKSKMLLLLYGAPQGVPESDLLAWLEYGNRSRFRSGILQPAHRARLIEYDKDVGMVWLSPVGSRYVEENLPLHVA